MDALADLDVPELQRRLAEWGQPPSHAARLLRHFYRLGGRIDLDQLPMRLSKTLQRTIQDQLLLRRSKIVHETTSADGTAKFLISLESGGAVETVLMPSFRDDRAMGCVSSQIGCAMGCDFCASTKHGLERNLQAGEIIEQFLHLREQATLRGRRLTTIVFMGMGEPMQNLEQVVAAVRRIGGENLGHLGFRHITVSTVGVVPGIDALADSGMNVYLAVSLHAPDDQTRQKIVPMNRRYRVADIIAAAQRYQEKTGRIVTIEYCLLAGVNDSDGQAEALADLLDDFRAHVNLIPYNAIGSGLSGMVYQRPDEQRLDRFVTILRDRGVVAHFRHTRGDDADAACGQLSNSLRRA